MCSIATIGLMSRAVWIVTRWRGFKTCMSNTMKPTCQKTRKPQRESGESESSQDEVIDWDSDVVAFAVGELGLRRSFMICRSASSGSRHTLIRGCKRRG